jgi:hypothetical protein
LFGVLGQTLDRTNFMLLMLILRSSKVSIITNIHIIIIHFKVNKISKWCYCIFLLYIAAHLRKSSHGKFKGCQSKCSCGKLQVNVNIWIFVEVSLEFSCCNSQSSWVVIQPILIIKGWWHHPKHNFVCKFLQSISCCSAWPTTMYIHTNLFR